MEPNYQKGVLYVYADGACDNKKGRNQMGIGVSIVYENHELLDYSSYEGLGTNNEAEYLALRVALVESQAIAAILKNDKFEVKSIIIMSDSQLIVNQYNGDWSCNMQSLIPFLNRCRAIRPSFPTKVMWIPREQNKRADFLSKRDLIRLGYREDKKLKKNGTQDKRHS